MLLRFCFVAVVPMYCCVLDRCCALVLCGYSGGGGYRYVVG